MRLLSFLTILAICLCFQSYANGQDPRQQRRRAFVEDLLRGLIESQIEPNRASGHDHTHPTRPNRPRPVQPSQQMMDARNQLNALSQHAAHLISDLRNEEQYHPQLRALLGDALQVKANIDGVYRKSMQFANVDAIVNDFKIVDRDWRILNHRLSQIGGLSRKCMKCVNDFHQMETGLCGVFGIQPQFDRREVARLANEFSSELRHLLQDIYYDCRDEPTLQRVMQRGQGLYSQINQAAGLIPRAPYDSVVQGYQGCAKEWRKFSRSVRKFRSKKLQRDIQRIEAIGTQIHELLWLPVELDRDYIVHTTNSIGQDVNRIFKDITLEQMLKCKRPGLLVNAAREFQGACGNFASGVGSGTTMDELLWDYRSFEVQWDDLHGHLRELETPRMARRVGEIENSLMVLRETFGDGPVINRGTLIQLAAGLNQLTSELARDVHFRITDRNYNHDFHGQICATADELNRCVRNLHQQCVSNPSAPAFRDGLDQVVRQWNAFKPMMHQCKDQDKLALWKIHQRIEPTMVKLQLAYVN